MVSNINLTQICSHIFLTNISNHKGSVGRVDGGVSVGLGSGRFSFFFHLPNEYQYHRQPSYKGVVLLIKWGCKFPGEGGGGIVHQILGNWV